MRQKRCICQKAYVAIQIDQGHAQRQFCDDRHFVAGFARMPRPGQCWYRSLLFRGVINFHRWNHRKGYGSFSGRKSQQKRSSPMFVFIITFFTITNPLAQGGKEGRIIPNIRRSRTSLLARSAFLGDIHRAPSRWGTAGSSISTG